MQVFITDKIGTFTFLYLDGSGGCFSYALFTQRKLIVNYQHVCSLTLSPTVLFVAQWRGFVFAKVAMIHCFTACINNFKFALVKTSILYIQPCFSLAERFDKHHEAFCNG